VFVSLCCRTVIDFGYRKRQFRPSLVVDEYLGAAPMVSKRKSSRVMGVSKAPTQLDALLGLRLRLRREDLGLSLGEVSRSLSLSEETLEGYEAGKQRICAAILFQFAEIFEVPIGWFYDGARSLSSGLGSAIVGPESMQKDQSLELLTHYFEELPRAGRDKLVAFARILKDPLNS
jgi:transcriptional regulator with XRE-family HTH domain